MAGRGFAFSPCKLDTPFDFRNCSGLHLINSGGITQLAFLSVTLSDSLIRTPASIAHSNDAAWEHVLPRPAMQVQCTYSYYSSCTFSEYPWNKWLLVPTLQMAHLCVKRQTEDHMCSY